MELSLSYISKRMLFQVLEIISYGYFTLLSNVLVYFISLVFSLLVVLVYTVKP